MNATVFTVTGMTCSHCELSVREEVSEVAGVASLEIDAQAGTLRVHHIAALDEAAIIAAVKEAGYAAVRS